MSDYTINISDQQIFKIDFIIRFLLVVAIIAAVVFIVISRNEGLAEYNRYMCANYGYYEDCKTPLAPEDRLK